MVRAQRRPELSTTTDLIEEHVARVQPLRERLCEQYWIQVTADTFQ